MTSARFGAPFCWTCCNLARRTRRTGDAAMAMFTSARQRDIVAEARAILAKGDRISAREPEVVFKTREDAAVARTSSARSAAAPSESAQTASWAEWSDN